MFIEKIRRRESGILLYGITPPKITASAEKIRVIAERTIQVLGACDIDALVVYDVQDESARTSEERPFPFVNALDPFEYASRYLELLPLPKIIYRPAGKFSGEALSVWLRGLAEFGHYPIFVGLPSPDSVVKTTLKEAYRIWEEQHAHHSVLGAITIPERHVILKDEDARILDKVECGVSYFISQCIFNVGYSKKVLHDLEVTFKERGVQMPTMIFTLTICGSVKTLQFMEWLGIYVPDEIKDDLITCASPISRSVEIATAIAKDLMLYCTEHSIPFGFNIESVATRKEEAEASLELLSIVNDLLKANGLRQGVKNLSAQFIG